MKKAIDLIKKVFSEWSEDKAAKNAAALAYYTVFSLPPLLVIIISLVGLFGQAAAAQGVVMSQVKDLLGPQGEQFVGDMIRAASKPSTGILATIIGIVTLLFGALGAFGELQNSLNTIWEVQPKPAKGFFGTLKSLIVDRLLSFAMILVIGFMLLVSLVVSAGLASLTQYVGGLLPFSDVVIMVINLVVSLAVITLLFALMFKFLPDAKIAWRDVWLGALVTAALFVVGKFAIGLYLGRSNIGTTFGAAGSLALLLIWIYYSAQILFLGAEFTQVYANTYGSKIVPNENALPLSEEQRAKQGLAHQETVENAARSGQSVASAAASSETRSEPGSGAASLETGSARSASAAAARPANTPSTASVTLNDWRQSPRSRHLLPPPQRRRSERTGAVISAALLTGVLALVASFAQIVHDVREPGDKL